MRVSYHHISLLKMIHLTMQYSLSRFLSLFNLPILLSFEQSLVALEAHLTRIERAVQVLLFPFWPSLRKTGISLCRLLYLLEFFESFFFPPL